MGKIKAISWFIIIVQSRGEFIMKQKSQIAVFAMISIICLGTSMQVSGQADQTNPGAWVSLFDGKTLDGWEQINGTAKYEVEGGCIKGTTSEGSPNSFLCTKKTFSNFVLEFEVLVDDRLNSGVQIRSNSFENYQNYRVHGYQVEIAAGGFSGFIYDEARRGQWIDEQNCDKEASNRAFIKGEWNKYIILCTGDHIFTWINGVNVAHISDSMTPSGFIGLQVHAFSGDSPASVQWRNIRIREL